ncbi:MAG TPA: sulfatase [Thermoanaerobaculia bacterium]|nr:sulfatase [Thermoanaerobaculia bacterium]
MAIRPFLTIVALSSVVAFVTAVPVRTPPSIILISIDTLRADHLSAYGYQRQTSPFIDSVARRGLLFECAIVPQPQTSPSHASMLTGVSPWKHGVLTNGFGMNGTVDTIAASLHRVGYGTAGVVAVSHLGKSRGFAAGFDQFSEPPAYNGHNNTRRDAEVVNSEAKSAIDAHVRARGAKPMFLFLHYFDCHYPYRSWDKTEDLSHAYDPQEQNQTAKQITRYDDGIQWVDKHLADITQYARAKLGENIILVITADHGEQIGDHDLAVGHADIYRETVRVPLIVAGPGVGAGRVTSMASTLDIPISIARLAGSRLRNAVDGVDLLHTAETEHSWMSRIFGSGEERSLLVTGTPTYTRSIALVKGSTWYIKNFDKAYRYSRVQSPAPAEHPPSKVLQGRISEQKMRYTVDVRQYRPIWITFEHVAKSPVCAASAQLIIDPGFMYYRDPLQFKGSIRVTVPAARLDSVTLLVTPVACAGATRYEVSREPPPGTTDNPDLFNYLVPRRNRPGDELYRVDEDPLMRRNVMPADGEPAWDRSLQSLFEANVRRVMQQDVPSEQLRALRALGYL